MPEDRSILPTESADWHLQLRSDRAYLFVGGLGVIGKSMSSWLIERGARHIIFLSRSAGEVSYDHDLIKELHAVGCATTRLSGSIADYEAVVIAVNSISLPIGGVFQTSMVLKVR
jgi:glutamyl-tRNA reductase